MRSDTALQQTLDKFRGLKKGDLPVSLREQDYLLYLRRACRYQADWKMQQGRVLKRFILPINMQATFSDIQEKTSMLLTTCFINIIVTTERKILEILVFLRPSDP